MEIYIINLFASPNRQGDGLFTQKASKTIECQQCGKKILETELNDHLQSSCDGPQLPCEFCSNNVPIAAYEEHLNACPKNPDNPENFQLPCEFCGKSFNAKVFKDHTTACENAFKANQGARNQQRPQAARPRDNPNFGFQYREENFNIHHPDSEEEPEPENLYDEQDSDDERTFANPPRTTAPNLMNINYSNQPNPRYHPSNGMRADLEAIMNVFQLIRDLRGPDAADGIRRILINPNMFGGTIQISGLNQGVGSGTLHSLPIVKFDSEKHKNLDDDSKKCSICLEDFKDGDEMKFLPCMMRFHTDCIDSWLKSHHTCPVCKKDVNAVDNIENLE